MREHGGGNDLQPFELEERGREREGEMRKKSE